MADFRDINRRIQDIIDQQVVGSVADGRSILHTLFPNDFELYMMALELTTFEGDTIDFFTFPVMPSQISKSEIHRTNVKKGLRGITIINSDSSTPSEISIRGNFGRSFKFLFNQGGSNPGVIKAIRYANASGVGSVEDVNSNIIDIRPSFSPDLKTGFGCIKILQSIISKSQGHENGKSFRLHLYNLSLNESYLVTTTKNPLVINQDENSNMLWNYTLNLVILGDLSKIDFGSSVKSSFQLISSDVIQRTVNNTVSELTKYLPV